MWLNAASRQLFSADILSLARQLGIPGQDEADERQRIAAIQRWLQRHDKWLLVLNNLEDSLILQQLVPLYSKGHVLLIARFQETEPLSNAISVSPMTIEDGALLLLRRAGIIPKRGSHDTVSEGHYLQAIAIAQQVEGYPLALDQAGAYLEETQQTLASYLTSYRERQATLLATRGHSASDHPEPVITTLSLTLEKVAQFNPHALDLLHCFAFLYPEALPDKILLHGTAALDELLRTLAHALEFSADCPSWKDFHHSTLAMTGMSRHLFCQKRACYSRRA